MKLQFRNTALAYYMTIHLRSANSFAAFAASLYLCSYYFVLQNLYSGVKKKKRKNLLASLATDSAVTGGQRNQTRFADREQNRADVYRPETCEQLPVGITRYTFNNSVDTEKIVCAFSIMVKCRHASCCWHNEICENPC